MANAQLYIQKIPSIEGTTVTEGDYNGHPTKFGVSVALIKTATGQTVSDDWLRKSALTDPLIQRAITFVWDSMQGNLIESQRIAELIVDHAYNVGFNRGACHLQNFLINKFKADIIADGKVSYKTVAALNVAIKQHGEDLVYRSFRQLRVNYYEGRSMTKNGTCNYWEGCKAAACKGLVVSRLNAYFPISGTPTANDNPDAPLSIELNKNAVNMAAISTATRDNSTAAVFCLLLIIGVCYYFLR
jgi:lysozyme family protein